MGEERAGSKGLYRTFKSIWLQHPDCRSWAKDNNSFVLSADLTFPKTARKIISD